MSTGLDPALAGLRAAAVAGSFYPASRTALASMVSELLGAAARHDGVRSARPKPGPAGILVPHAGLVYSGVVAAAGWRPLAPEANPPDEGATTIVLLGTNHRAGWLRGVGAWESGAWRIPTGEMNVETSLAAAIVALGAPFLVDRDAHAFEHSIEVQLPLLHAIQPLARIVPLTVSTGSGEAALSGGDRLGTLLAERRSAGDRIVLAISTDMAHYPSEAACRAVTEALLPPILALDAARLAKAESDVRAARTAGLVCGMCGIEPAIMGLAALRAMGATSATALASGTSADAGGPSDRTVGYLSVRFDT